MYTTNIHIGTLYTHKYVYMYFSEDKCIFLRIANLWKHHWLWFLSDTSVDSGADITHSGIEAPQSSFLCLSYWMLDWLHGTSVKTVTSSTLVQEGCQIECEHGMDRLSWACPFHPLLNAKEMCLARASYFQSQVTDVLGLVSGTPPRFPPFKRQRG